MSAIRNSKTKTFGILTSGGDCPGLNAAIRGVCRAAHDRYGMKIFGIADGFQGLINGNVHPLNPIDFSGILTRGGTIVVVAEGALSIEEAKMDKHELKKYHAENGPSVGYRVAREIEQETGVETRATVLGYVQRGGIPSASDRILATSLGTMAADILAKGEYGRMVALDGDKITTVNLNIPESKVKSVPENHYMIDTAIAVGTCMGID
jgi:6-phosphofructokinase